MSFVETRGTCEGRARFFVNQNLAIVLVAFDNQSRFSVNAKTSIDAKYFGAFGAGLPNGVNSFELAPVWWTPGAEDLG